MDKNRRKLVESVARAVAFGATSAIVEHMWGGLSWLMEKLVSAALW